MTAINPTTFISLASYNGGADDEAKAKEKERHIKMGKIGVGILVALGLTIALGLFGMPIPFAVAIGGIAGGIVAAYLFSRKDLDRQTPPAQIHSQRIIRA